MVGKLQASPGIARASSAVAQSRRGSRFLRLDDALLLQLLDLARIIAELAAEHLLGVLP